MCAAPVCYSMRYPITSNVIKTCGLTTSLQLTSTVTTVNKVYQSNAISLQSSSSKPPSKALSLTENEIEARTLEFFLKRCKKNDLEAVQRALATGRISPWQCMAGIVRAVSLDDPRMIDLLLVYMKELIKAPSTRETALDALRSFVPVALMKAEGKNFSWVSLRIEIEFPSLFAEFNPVWVFMSDPVRTGLLLRKEKERLERAGFFEKFSEDQYPNLVEEISYGNTKDSYDSLIQCLMEEKPYEKAMLEALACMCRFGYATENRDKIEKPSTTNYICPYTYRSLFKVLLQLQNIGTVEFEKLFATACVAGYAEVVKEILATGKIDPFSFAVSQGLNIAKESHYKKIVREIEKAMAVKIEPSAGQEMSKKPFFPSIEESDEKESAPN